MRTFFIVTLGALMAVTTLSGCKTVDSKNLKAKVDSLETRVGAIEQKQGGADTLGQTAGEGYYSEKRSTAPEVSSVSMSKSDIQRALKNAGVYDGAIDGKIGPQTRTAIKAFQSEHGLKADGIAGKRTKKALAVYLTSQV